MVFETWITLATSYCVFLLYSGRYVDVCEDGNCFFITFFVKKKMFTSCNSVDDNVVIMPTHKRSAAGKGTSPC